ncbi:MAG TPA: APC family permease [Stellaceae bacterium]|nr:APC family permease [Stellaceae bacterium]
MRRLIQRLKPVVVGKPLNALAADVHRSMALAAFVAWVGLGADGLSSANYGPEESFLALGANTHLALYLAIATALTVFLISLGYNEVIALFPSGGGGYKVATTLIGPYAGLVSGAALIVDYVLTIAISVASGVDALFSLLPLGFQTFKLETEVVITLMLMVLNLRGMREPLKVLVPIFIGFVLTHGALIVYGIAVHVPMMPTLLPDTWSQTVGFAHQIGWLGVISLLLRAYSLGGGTYTGIEAVSNNVNTLKEPRVRTGRWTMAYMALSLSFMAGGLILLYLLWHTVAIPGQTLNAVVFQQILGTIWGFGTRDSEIALLVVLVFAALILFVGANTGFLGGPAVLANMAADRWVPYQFSQLSNRLVTQNGVLLMAGAAIATLLLTVGDVDVLVVLYSINVFVTFTLCLLGLCVYWWGQHRKKAAHALRHLLLAGIACFVTGSILLVTVYEKFLEGGWLTVCVTGCVVTLGIMIRRHYRMTARELAKVDALFATSVPTHIRLVQPPQIDPEQPTAVFLVGRSIGAGMHTLLSLRRLFPSQFKNFVFLSVGEVDSESFRGKERLASLQKEVSETLDHFVAYCHQRGLPARTYSGFGPDTINEINLQVDQILRDFPNSVFFASKLIFNEDNWFIRQLHNGISLTVQQRLHRRGIPMVILPMNI